MIRARADEVLPLASAHLDPRVVSVLGMGAGPLGPDSLSSLPAPVARRCKVERKTTPPFTNGAALRAAARKGGQTSRRPDEGTHIETN